LFVSPQPFHPLNLHNQDTVVYDNYPKMSDEEDGNRFPLSKNRFVTVSTFKGKVRVDIREFYMTDDGERRPGKKGISLSLEEWKKLASNLSDIQKAIKKEGGEISDSESESD